MWTKKKLLTVAITAGIETDSVEALVPTLDSLKVLLPVGRVLAGSISSVGSKTESLVGECRGLCRKEQQAGREFTQRAKKLHVGSSRICRFEMVEMPRWEEFWRTQFFYRTGKLRGPLFRASMPVPF